jgi:chromosome segregation ATPase
MVEFAALPQAAGSKLIAGAAAIVVLGGTLGGYAIHEHNTAQNLAAQNVQANAALTATQHQLSDLTAKVNMLATRNEAQNESQSASSARAARTATGRRPTAARRQREDPRFKKLQAQLDAQGKAIDDTRNDLAGTKGDLVSTRTELSGSIAHTHSELVLLQKRGRATPSLTFRDRKTSGALDRLRSA